MVRNLIIVGFSGSGKTSVGRILADRLGWRFVDSDDEIVHDQGLAIAQIFATHGEDRFRTLERGMIARLCSDSNQVISVGGGTIVDQYNKRIMLDGNYVVRLVASPETILSRLSSTNLSERPMLTSSDPLGRISRLLADREEHYSAAQLQVDTEGMTPAEVADSVLVATKGMVS